MRTDWLGTLKQIGLDSLTGLKKYSGKLLGFLATIVLLVCGFMASAVFSFFAQMMLIFNREDSSLLVFSCVLFMAVVTALVYRFNR